jgi:hypothetical protein
MKEWLGIVLAIMILFFFSYGCSTTSQNTMIRCPKCGAYFNTKEGAETFEWMRAQ